MKIEAKVIADSVSDAGKRITTLELCYPRFIHGEVMTHRVFSRNAMSSRAVPVKKMIEQVRKDPVIPYRFGLNQPGMQAAQDATGERLAKAQSEWKRAAEHAAYFADQLDGLGIHKQVVNRLLEPFQWMRTIVTATEWENFFGLRLHEMAEPHFQLLAREMSAAREASRPTERAGRLEAEALRVENWHLPYIKDEERNGNSAITLAKISSARCARVSYLTHDGKAPDPEKDLDLFEKLYSASPMHASPMEHSAVPLPGADASSANFRGWLQFRQIL